MVQHASSNQGLLKIEIEACCTRNRAAMRNKYLTDQFYSNPERISRKAKFRARFNAGLSQPGQGDYFSGIDGFKCANCGLFVSTDTLLSGVNNRNHCPYCLWSRHLDLQKSGDRLAACKAVMQPVGLTLKKRRKKYGSEKDGELMLIHLCTDCGKVSINRVAADDDPGKVFEIFGRSTGLDERTAVRLAEQGIQALRDWDEEIVHARLLGWESGGLNANYLELA